MKDELDNDTQQKARELARKITVAHDLDPEIQEELYGHIENNLLAYKSGEESISDEDAFILVREHFGEAQVIRGLLREVHARAVTLSLVRRIGTACIIVLAVEWWCRLLALPLQGLARSSVMDGEFSSQSGAIAFFLYHASSFLYPIGTAITFLYLRRRIETGRTLWFHRWRLRVFLQAGALLMLARYFTPAYETISFHTLADELTGLTPGEGYSTLASWVLLCWLCVTWLWWCDVSLRRPQGVLYCMTGWMAMAMLVRHFPVQLVLTAASEPGTTLNPSDSIVLLGVSYTWTIEHLFTTRSLDHLLSDLRLLPLVGVSSLLVYGVRSHLHFLIKANTKYPRPITGFQVTGICFFHANLLWALFRNQPWAMSVTVSLLVSFISLLLYAAANLVYVPRASATGSPYLARALRHASKGILFLTFLFSLYNHTPDSTSDGISRVTFMVGTIVASTCFVAAAAVNWWKSNISNQEHDALVRK